MSNGLQSGSGNRRSWIGLLLAVVFAAAIFGAFVAGYLLGHAHGFCDAERLQIGDEAAGLKPGELP